MATEYLIKLCLAKINWNEYLASYGVKSTFEDAKNQLIKDFPSKYTEPQSARILDVLEYVQVQRNKFVHSPFKGYDFHLVARQIYIALGALMHKYSFNASIAANTY